MISKETLTYSAIKSFQSCRWKYNQRYNNNLTPSKEKDVLYLGSVWHSVLEIWYGHGDYESKLKKITILIDKSFPDYISDSKQKQNWHLCHAMFQGYINRSSSLFYVGNPYLSFPTIKYMTVMKYSIDLYPLALFLAA